VRSRYRLKWRRVGAVTIVWFAWIGVWLGIVQLFTGDHTTARHVGNEVAVCSLGVFVVVIVAALRRS
jgi:hypothetical protein